MKTIKPITVLLADDHVLMLELWSFVISQDPRFKLLGKSPSATIAVDMARRNKPDIIFMDIHIGPIDGFEATRLIRNYSPKSKIIGLSASALTAYSKRMKALGGMGFVTKCSPYQEIITAIESALNGQYYNCKVIQRAMLMEEKMYGKQPDESTSLTTRELEIIELLKNGLSSKQVSENLSISINTVRVHRNNIFRKLNVSNVTSLVQLMHIKGIIS